MFVRNLIGRNHGQIQEQPYHVASSNIAMGTAEIVTDEEIREAGLEPPAANLRESVERFPDGYVVKKDDVWGYNVFDPKGEQVGSQPLGNLTVARSAAYNHLDALAAEAAAKAAAKKGGAAGTTAPTPIGDTDVVKLSALTVAKLDALAAEMGINLATAKNKAEKIALIERALAEKAAAAGV